MHSLSKQRSMNVDIEARINAQTAEVSNVEMERVKKSERAFGSIEANTFAGLSQVSRSSVH